MQLIYLKPQDGPEHEAGVEPELPASSWLPQATAARALPRRVETSLGPPTPPCFRETEDSWFRHKLGLVPMPLTPQGPADTHPG